MRLRQSLPVGLLADGVCAEPAVLSVQAVLVILASVPAPATVISERVSWEPTFNVPLPVVSQVTTLPTAEHDHPADSEPGVNVSLGPRVSVIRIGFVGEYVATEGPRLRTRIVEVTLAPGATGLGVFVFERSSRSALGSSTSKVSVAVSLLGSGSGKPAGGATVALLVSVPPVAVAPVTGIEKTAWPVALSAPAVHVTVWPAALQPDGKLPIVSELSIVSVMVAPADIACGPVLRIVKVIVAASPVIIVGGIVFSASRSLPGLTLVTT